MRKLERWLLAALLLAGAGPAGAAELPGGIARQLPAGYDVLGAASASFGSPARAFHIVALGKQGEAVRGETRAPARPLLVFERQPDGSFRQVGRNDDVVLHADEGGQCDPFLDGSGTIAVKGRYFTVQNGVACGQHWTDYVTFRFDDALGRYVFDNERSESWVLNPSNAPNAEALVRDMPPRVRRGDRRNPVPFERWRPSR